MGPRSGPLFLCVMDMSDSSVIIPAGVAGQVFKLIEPTVDAMGYELVRVRLLSEKTQILQIMAERPDMTMDVDACADLSRALSALLDVEDPISGEYVLEVSSPGVDRPLTRPKHFEAFDGCEAKLELSVPVDGQRRFRGVLDGVEDGEIRLDTPEHGILGFAFDMIADAKLVMSDALMKKQNPAKKKKAGQASEDHHGG